MCLFAAVAGLSVAYSVQAQVEERELFLMSYPNAQIDVDGDISDWNLEQFGTVVVGGENPFPQDDQDYQRLTGTGDIARVGWDEAGETVNYAGRWTAAVLPEEPIDHSARIYARDSTTHQYFLVDITDDEINTGSDAAWANDSVEFYFDPDDSGGPRDTEHDVQLVIDAANRVQVWDSSDAYKAQIEAGVTAVVATTETGWLVEVGVDKTVFAVPLPSILGPANDPEGNNFGIDFNFRDNDDPFLVADEGGDTSFTTVYDWADPTSGGGFPSKQPGLWGQMFAPEQTTVETCGDFDMDMDVDTADRNIQVSNWTGALNDGSGTATFGDGDCDNDGDVDTADQNGLINNWTGALMNGMAGNTTDGADADLIYDPANGNVTLDASDTSSGLFISFVLGANDGMRPENLTESAPGNAGPFFDVGTNTDAKTFQIGQTDPLNQGAGPEINLGDIFPAGLDLAGLADYLTLANYASELGAGGELDLIVRIPEPSSIALMLLGAFGLVLRRRRK